MPPNKKTKQRKVKKKVKRKIVKKRPTKKTKKKRGAKKKVVRKTRARPAKKKGKGGGAGRPRLVIDKDLLEQLAKIQCTMEEIAAVLGCSVDTLERNFADTIKKGKDEGKASLRRLQWKGAQDGKPAMLIWLGKQVLAQKETVITEHTGELTIRKIQRTIVDPKAGSKRK